MQRVTTWSEHAKHYILKSDFDAALISETHLDREKLVTAAKARKFSWAGTGSPAISTASNGTSAGVLALVRTRSFSKPLSICTDEAGVLCPNKRLAGRVIRVEGRDFHVYSLFRALRSFLQRHQRQFDARRVFSHERRKAFYSFWERISISRQACGKTCPCMAAVFGFGSWEHQWSFQRNPHTRAVQAKARHHRFNTH